MPATFRFGTDKAADDFYVESYSISFAGETADVKDKDGKLKARAHFGFKMECSASGVAKGALPELGEDFEVDGKNFVITSVEETGSNGEFVKVSLKGVLYGDGTAGPTPDTED
jgi:hypothetical protein